MSTMDKLLVVLLVRKFVDGIFLGALIVRVIFEQIIYSIFNDVLTIWTISFNAIFFGVLRSSEWSLSKHLSCTRTVSCLPYYMFLIYFSYILYIFSCIFVSLIYPTPRNALSVRWFVTFFTPSNANAHMWACALDFGSHGLSARRARWTKSRRASN